MLRRFSTDFAIFSIGVDLILVGISLSLVTYLRPAFNNLPYIKDIPTSPVLPGILYIVFPPLWVVVLWIFSAYDARRNFRVWNELSSLTAGSFIAGIAAAGILYLSYREISRFLFLSFATSAYLMIVLWRLAYRWAFRHGILKAVEPRNILVVGINELSNGLVQQIASYQNLGFNFTGYLSDLEDIENAPPNVLGKIDQVREIVEKYQVDDLVITIPPEDYGQLYSRVKDLYSLPVKVWVVPNYDQLVTYRVNLEELAGIPMLDIHAPGLRDDQRLLKRAFDIIIILLFLPLNLIFMLCIALAIWFEESSPTIFTQKRVGENGRIFDIYKFRTMVVDAENQLHTVVSINAQGQESYKHKDDPRITRVGRFLRRTSLDELPQIFNVLKGEMSLVGPRPEQPYLVQKYEPWQYIRFTVPPGMTGWWQVHGRSDNPLHLNTEDDLYYIENYSLFLDIIILIKTIKVLLSRKGAY